MRAQVTGIAETRSAVPVFAALGDPTRLALVARLSRDGPLPTIELMHGGGVTRQGLTKHLRVLEDAGLVTSGRIGCDRQWRLEVQPLAAIRAYLDQISAEWDLRIERLRRFVEDEGD